MILPTSMSRQPVLNRRYAYIAIVVLVLIWTWAFLRQTFDHDSISRHFLTSASSQPNTQPALYGYETFDPTAIRRVCETTQWTPGLVFTCNESAGGIGNLRNSILSCVRYAIEAGASLVVPNIVLRDAEDISKIWNQERTGLDYLFNLEHFHVSLQLACPQLQLLPTLESFANVASAQKEIRLHPESIEGKDIPKTGLAHPERWAETFQSWLLNQTSPSETAPVIIHLERSYLQYPVYYDGADFVNNFGRILEFRDDARLLASKLLSIMSATYQLSIDQMQPLAQNAFFGVHLRTEVDSQKGWPTDFWTYSRFETQAELYLGQAPRSNTSVIYVASGDVDEVAKFAIEAQAKLNMTVVTKNSVLEGKDLGVLNSMAWDQQAAVDYLVMLRATDFAGVAHSSFAWNIALKRRKYSKVEKYLEGPQMLSDELSQVYGKVGDYPEYAACMWP